MSNKVATRVSTRSCVRAFMIKELAILVYSTIIFPPLDYSDIAWSKFDLHRDMDSVNKLDLPGCPG